MTVREIWLTTTCDLYARRDGSDETPRKLPAGGILREEDGRMQVVGITPRKYPSESTPHLILSVVPPAEVTA